MTEHGHVIWSELNSHDPDAAKRFFSETLGWEFESLRLADGDTYGIIKQDGHRVGGLFTLAGLEFDGVSDHWLTYVSVDDVDRRLSSAMEAGATVLRDPWSIAGVGRMAILRAPGGGVMAWMTPERVAA